MKLKYLLLSALIILLLLLTQGVYALSDELSISSFAVGETISITVIPSENKCDPAGFPRNLRHANLNYFLVDNVQILDFNNATIDVYRNGEPLNGFLYHRDDDGIVWFASQDESGNTALIDFDDKMSIEINDVQVVGAGRAAINSNIAFFPWDDCYELDALPPYPIGSDPVYNPDYLVTFNQPTPTTPPTSTPEPTIAPSSTPTSTPTPIPTDTPTPTPMVLPTPTPSSVFDFGSRLLTLRKRIEELRNKFQIPSSTPTVTPTPTNVPQLTITPTPTLTITPTPTITPIPSEDDNSFITVMLQELRKKFEDLRKLFY